MAAPAVSVVLPTYNRASTLERAINSVLNQTFADLELIVVDDGSTDATRGVLASYGGHGNVHVIATPHNGCAAARNIGVRRSQARYVAFQDSDDEWEPYKLAAAVSALDLTGPDTGVFYSDMRMILRDGRSPVLISPKVTRGALIDERTLDYQVRYIGIQSAVIKRECFERAGYFDEALPRLIDLELFIRLADSYRFVRSPEPLVKYHFGDGISSNTEALVWARRYLLRKYGARLKQHRRHIAGQYLYLALALEDNRERLASQGYFLRALLTSPAHARLMKGVVDLARAIQRAATVSTVRPSAARLVTAAAGAGAVPPAPGGRDDT
jgi:glycosyltransferase involved in cell wall biosynthesis